MRRASILAALLALAFMSTMAHAQSVQPCRTGTAASYAGTSCSQGAVTYTFPPGWYVLSSSAIPEISADSVNIRMDPQGPYTFLIGSAAWNLRQPNESFHVTLNFKVSGATRIEGWSHDCVATEDAVILESITVKTNPPVTQNTSCGARTPDLQFAVAPGTWDTTVEISGESRHGMAGLRSFGTHFKP